MSVDTPGGSVPGGGGGNPIPPPSAIKEFFKWMARGIASQWNKFSGGAALLASKASVLDKLQRYLLNPDHPVGKDKAKWFKEALGYTLDNAQKLADQINFDPLKAELTEVTEYGMKYNQVITITGANGRSIDVLTAWIKNNDGIVRFVTAVPAKK
jgi:hypothetical protein